MSFIHFSSPPYRHNIAATCVLKMPLNHNHPSIHSFPPFTAFMITIFSHLRRLWRASHSSTSPGSAWHFLVLYTQKGEDAATVVHTTAICLSRAQMLKLNQCSWLLNWVTTAHHVFGWMWLTVRWPLDLSIVSYGTRKKIISLDIVQHHHTNVLYLWLLLTVSTRVSRPQMYINILLDTVLATDVNKCSLASARCQPIWQTHLVNGIYS